MYCNNLLENRLFQSICVVLGIRLYLLYDVQLMVERLPYKIFWSAKDALTTNNGNASLIFPWYNI